MQQNGFGQTGLQAGRSLDSERWQIVGKQSGVEGERRTVHRNPVRDDFMQHEIGAVRAHADDIEVRRDAWLARPDRRLLPLGCTLSDIIHSDRRAVWAGWSAVKGD